MDKIAIVTVDYNGHEDTLELLKSAKDLDTEGDEVKWFLVDNGSETPLEDYLRKDLLKSFEVLQTGENKGFAGGYNHGIRYALAWGADYIFVVNNDTLIGDEKVLKKLLGVLKKEPKAALVSPKILFAPGFEFHKDWYKKSDEGKVIWWAGADFDWDNIRLVHRGLDEVDKGQFDRTEETEFVSGCCFLVKSQCLQEAGLFNEKLFAYFEDDELIMGLKKAGRKIFYQGKTYIYHKVSQTAGIGSSITDYLLTRNRLYFGMKYAPLRTKLALLKETFRFLIVGRETQRRGVMDFLKCRFGPPPELAGEKKEAKYPLELSMVIVNYKTLKLTEDLLRTIYKNSPSGDFEIVLLDNASDDGIGEIVKSKFPKVKFIQNKENTGFAKGYNKAISYTKGKYILLLNSDIQVKKGALEKLVEFAKRHNDEVVVVGKLILPTGEVQKSCYKLPTIWGAIKEYFLGRKGEYSQFAPSSFGSTRVEGAIMACFLIPRKALNMAGFLSEESFMYFEDIEYCRRLRKKEIPIYYLPKAEFLHYHGAASKKLGLEKAQELLKKGAISYHGRLKYLVLWLILWAGQKI